MGSKSSNESKLPPVRARLVRDPLTWPQPDFPSWIRTVPLPHAASSRTMIAGAPMIGLLLLVLFAVLILLPVAARGWSNLTTVEMAIYGGVLFMIAIVFVGFWVDQARERRFLVRKLRSSRWAPTLKALQAARPPFRRSAPRKASGVWIDLANAFTERGLDRPRTIADLRVALELERLPIADELVEPEKIVSGSRSDRRNRRNSIINGLVGVTIGLLTGATVCIVVGIAMILIPMLSLHRIRKSAPDLMLGLSATVAGPGFLVWNERLVFRSDAALCLLRSIGTVRNTDPAVEAWFYSPEGIRMLAFPSVHDPQFVEFWKRWNHPNPRHELAGET
tara:strand:+ start:1145 stop:2149 length:1005 start_codon:yes stop_codon:yes gene_type:complete